MIVTRGLAKKRKKHVSFFSKNAIEKNREDKFCAKNAEQFAEVRAKR
jgi:hypothetical protein